MPLHTPDFPPLSDSDDFPPHHPPAKTVNESQQYIDGSAVKVGDRVVIITPTIAAAHSWMASMGYTRRHAIVLVTTMLWPPDVFHMEIGVGQVCVIRGSEQGAFYDEIVRMVQEIVGDWIPVEQWQTIG